jgi:hypothetical protein
MKSQSNKQVMKNTRLIVAKSTLAFSALVTLIGSTVVSAPGAYAYSGPYDPSTGLGSRNCILQGLGPDQDSLLPPEVVPMDSTAAANYQASQSQPAQMNPYSAPAAAANHAMSQAPTAAAAAPAAAMQSSQEWRKAAFDSLMNNPSAQPAFGTQQPQMAANNGSQAGMGQSGWTGANGQPMQAPAQSQTLSGQTQQQSYPKKNSGPSKIAGVAHMASMATMFGSGALTGALMTRGSSPMGFYGPGLMGASMMNYGLRSGFGGW